VRKIHTIFN